MNKIELASAAQASSDLQKESTVAPRKAASKPLGYPFDEREILSRAATSYTLQLFGTQDSASALAQKATRYQALDLKIAQVKRQGKPWLIGLAGEFPDRAKAMEYASSQGELITENGFWIRRFSDVQNQIKRRLAKPHALTTTQLLVHRTSLDASAMRSVGRGSFRETGGHDVD